jgi:hypothetical protein
MGDGFWRRVVVPCWVMDNEGRVMERRESEGEGSLSGALECYFHAASRTAQAFA